VTNRSERSISKWSGERSSETMRITISRQSKPKAAAGWKKERSRRKDEERVANRE